METTPGFFQVSTTVMFGLLLFSNWVNRKEAQEARSKVEELEQRIGEALEYGMPSASDSSTKADVRRSAALIGWRDSLKKKE